MQVTEFYTSPDGSDILYYHPQQVGRLTPADIPLINELFFTIKEAYPNAHAFLEAKFMHNKLKDWFVVSQFIKCNFGSHDDRPDITETGILQLENVHCPMRGICEMESIVCHPKRNNNLSAKEIKLVKDLVTNKPETQIADEHCMSIFTLKNIRKRIYAKLNIHSRRELILKQMVIC